ncbi:hypothetical protein POV27_09720 [Aureisphaera galaxeae]|uniref:hypothetical protein n=1 Tax=Aureisphaera galaxeae TaxID=1538023 RepID=UPI002350EAA9|nr:hypothetical protein [Aureisphaera galaxeae]MDC8004329.1 hypothetical protein [Aureisphaera galaxeae]
MSIMNVTAQTINSNTDHSKKSILARGCDPYLSNQFARMIPPRIGNAHYVPTTNDEDFIEKLKSKQWSIIYFAPGACRFSAAKKQIPGGNTDTAGWTLKEYKDLILKLQGSDVRIVETTQESEAIALLNVALEGARTTE